MKKKGKINDLSNSKRLKSFPHVICLRIYIVHKLSSVGVTKKKIRLTLCQQNCRGLLSHVGNPSKPSFPNTAFWGEIFQK